MKKMLFVFNPNSGKAKIKNVLLNIIQILSEADYEITVYPTRAARDGYRYILGNQGKYDVIACSGGDGTVNEAVAAVLRYKGKKPPIAYIPSGTTNDFATSLNIPKDMISAAHNIAEGVPMKIDIGLVNRKRTFIMLRHLALLQRCHMQHLSRLRIFLDIRPMWLKLLRAYQHLHLTV